LHTFLEMHEHVRSYRQDLVLPSSRNLSGLPGWHFNADLRTSGIIQVVYHEKMLFGM